MMQMNEVFDENDMRKLDIEGWDKCCRKFGHFIAGNNMSRGFTDFESPFPINFLF